MTSAASSLGAVRRGIFTDVNIKLPSVPWSLRDVLLGIVFVALGVVLVRVLLFDDRSLIAIDRNFANTIGIFLIESLLFLAVLLFAVRKYDIRWHALGVHQEYKASDYWLVAAVIVAILLANAAYATLVSYMGLKDLEPPGVPTTLVGTGAFRFFNVMIIGVWGPMAEELFFRGFVLPALVPRFKLGGAIAISSALFAISHGSFAVAVPIFVSGMLLAWLYVKSKSLWPSIGAHSVQNLLALAFAGYL